MFPLDLPSGRRWCLRRKLLSRLWLLLPVAVAIIPGCQQQEEVRAYTVAKPPPAVRPAADPNSEADDEEGRPFNARNARGAPPRGGDPADSVAGRLIALVIPQEKQTWFFKLSGPTQAVTAQAEAALGFLQSLKFVNGEPTWALPPGWTAKPGNQFRFATLAIKSDEGPLEMTVSSLVTPEGDFEEYLLLNVNRWRGQMQVPPLKKEELGEKMRRFDLEDFTAWFVLIDGRVEASEAAARAAARGQTGPPRGPAAAVPSKDLDFTYDAPPEWVQRPPAQFRLLDFGVRDGGQEVTISVSAVRGGVVANLNRWRDQVGLPKVEEAELRQSLQKLEVGPLTADYVTLLSPEGSPKPEAIFGATLQARGQQWYFKLNGDAELAKREQPRFEEFVRSIRFRGAEGSNDGK